MNSRPGTGTEPGPSAGAAPVHPAAAAGELEAGPARRPLVLAALVIGMFMAAIEATVVATAVPSIVGDLQGFHLFSWLFSSFTLAQAVTTPLFGRLSDIIGRKPVYAAGAGLFLVGSLLCGLSGSMVQLILFRGIQGLGAGAIFPMAMTIVGDIYTPVERARIQGYLSSVWGISSVIGPALGGVLVSTLGWPWVFYVNLPIGVVSVAMLLAFHREPPRRRGARLDLAGAALLVLGVTSLIVLLTQRQTVALTSGPGLVLAALAVAGLAAFIYWERRAPEPLLPLELITRPLIAAANTGAALAGVLVIALSSLVPLFVQGVLGRSPTVAGFSLAAMSIGWPLAATASGHLILRTGYRRTAALGALFGVAGAGVLLTAGTGTSPFWVALGTALSGAGFGLTTTPYVIAIQSAVPYQERGVTTASHAFARQLGQAVGAAVVGGFLTSRLVAHLQAADVPGAGEVGVDAVNQLLAEGTAVLPAGVQGALLSSLDAAIHDTLLGVLVLSAAVLLVARRLPPDGPTDESRG